MSKILVRSVLCALAMCLLFGITVTLLVPPPPALAADACRELQIVFLLDQSGSMGGRVTGSTVHPEANDPRGMRFLALRRAVEMLGPLRFQAHRTSDIRIARVDFGETAQIGFDWQTISPDDENAWNQQLQALDANLQAGRWATSNLGGTNFRVAFEKAEELFKKVPPQVGDCPLRAVIVITDGKPEIPGVNVAGHFQDLTGYLTRAMPSPNYNLFTIALNDSKDNYWTESQPFWSVIVGDEKRQEEKEKRSRKLESPDDILERLNDYMFPLVKRLAGSGESVESICPGTIAVGPYLQSVTFQLVKDRVENHLLIEDILGPVDKNRKDISVSVQGFDTPAEAVRVTRPLPGFWKVRTTFESSTKCDIQKIIIRAGTKITVPNPSDTLVQYTRVNLAFEILDLQGQGIALPDYDPRYALNAQARISNNLGVQDFNLAKTGKNAYSAAFIPVETGPHSLEVTATSNDVEGKAITVVDQIVDPPLQIVPAKLVLTQGPGTEPIPSRVPISITISPAGPTRKPVRLEVPLTITVTVTTITQTKRLQLTPTPDGSYGTTFTPDAPGTYRLQFEGGVTGLGRTLQGEDIKFDVFPAIILRPRLAPASSDTFVASNEFGQLLGMNFELQIVDENNQPVDPTQVIEGESRQIFNVRVLDSSGTDRSRELGVAYQDLARVYRGEAKSYGPEQYTVRVTPSGKLKKGYAWGAPNWTFRFTGNANPAFYVLLVLGALATLDVLQWGVRWGLRRPHPMRGWAFIAEITEDPEPRVVWRKRLPNANFARYSNGFGWKGLLPWWNKDFMPKLNIRRLEVRCQSTEHAQQGNYRVDIWTVKGQRSFVLNRNEGLGAARDLGHGGYIIYL